jgi:hypothetical protein
MRGVRSTVTNTSPYMFSVVEACSSPLTRWTSSIGTPSEMSRVAEEWRRSWNRTPP